MHYVALITLTPWFIVFLSLFLSHSHCVSHCYSTHTRQYGFSSLHCAAINQHKDIVETLLTHNADVKAETKVIEIFECVCMCDGIVIMCARDVRMTFVC